MTITPQKLLEIATFAGVRLGQEKATAFMSKYLIVHSDESGRFAFNAGDFRRAVKDEAKRMKDAVAA